MIIQLLRSIEVLELEQYYINELNPNLNVDLIAGGYFGYHTPMSTENRIKLRKERGQIIYVYDVNNVEIPCLLFISDSKEYLINNINISRETLNDCLVNGDLYLDKFLFSYDLIEEFTNSLINNLLTIEDLKIITGNQRNNFKIKQPWRTP